MKEQVPVMLGTDLAYTLCAFYSCLHPSISDYTEWWLVSIGAGRAKGRETNNRWSRPNNRQK